jgi:hypothetical protein
VIHGYGSPETDASLAIVLDIMRLQQELGTDTVVMLLGNHELPHIYGVTLSKGEKEFTSRFEHALGGYRDTVLSFFDGLPFYICTPGGVMLTHAGPVMSAATPQVAALLTDFSHSGLLVEADRLLAHTDAAQLIHSTLNMTAQQYYENAIDYLAVTGPDDPRYYELLRGFVVSSLKEWQPLWDFFFNQCEAGLSLALYDRVVIQYLSSYSSANNPQQVVVTGHMPTRGGYQIVTKHHLRLSSWMHATPREAGCYLLFEVAEAITQAADLEGSICALGS